MSRRVTAIGLLVILATCETYAQAPHTDENDRSEEAGAGWDRYELLVRRNIFMRDRSIRRPAPERRPSAPRRIRIVTRCVLLGAVQHGGNLLALFENRNTGEILRLAPGDTILDATVERITMREVTVRRGEETRLLLPGSSLTKEAETFASNEEGDDTEPDAESTSDERQAPSDTASGSDEAPSGGSSDILERMRKRRQEQLDN